MASFEFRTAKGEPKVREAIQSSMADMLRKRIEHICWGAVVLLIFAAIAAYFVPLPPHGRFATPDIGNMADAYFELYDGKVTWVVWSGERGRQGEELRRFIGDYQKQGGRWLVNASGQTTELRATLYSLEIIESNGARAGPFYRYPFHTGR
jgi:hypothetical protein